jgi:hypothetical protein
VPSSARPAKTSVSLPPPAQRGLAPSALLGRGARVVLGPLPALRSGHLPDHEITRGDLLADEVELRLARLGSSLLDRPSHLQSLAVVGRAPAAGVKSVSVAVASERPRVA